MSKKATLCWCVEGHTYLAAHNAQYFGLELNEIEDRESQLQSEKTKLANSKWLINQRNNLKTGLIKYPDNKEFTNSASKRRNFHAIFEKFFTGEVWEKHVLRTLRLDLFILCCFLFVPTQFDEIYVRGLQDVFTEELNRYFHAHSPKLVIPQWAGKRAKSKINANTEEAKQLRLGISCISRSLLSC